MNRKLLFFPAWDKTHEDPKKDYGVNPLELRFLVTGESGVVEFQLLTNWYQEHVMQRRLEETRRDVWRGKEDFLMRHWLDPFPADVCYFSPKRISEDDTFFEKGLDYIFDHSPCYYGYKFQEEDGSFSRYFAYKLLVEQGDEALWKYLENYYIETFGKE